MFTLPRISFTLCWLALFSISLSLSIKTDFFDLMRKACFRKTVDTRYIFPMFCCMGITPFSYVCFFIPMSIAWKLLSSSDSSVCCILHISPWISQRKPEGVFTDWVNEWLTGIWAGRCLLWYASILHNINTCQFKLLTFFFSSIHSPPHLPPMRMIISILLILNVVMFCENRTYAMLCRSSKKILILPLWHKNGTSQIQLLLLRYS